MLSSWFNLLGLRVSNFCIQTFSLWIRRSLKISLSRFVFVNLSIIVNLNCLLNLWPFFETVYLLLLLWGSFISFLWLFNLMLNGVLFLPTYLQFAMWNIFQVLFVCWLLNVAIVFTCLRDIFPGFDLHGVHLPYFKVFISFLTLPFSIQCVQITSWMFSFLLNAVIVFFFKFL